MSSDYVDHLMCCHIYKGTYIMSDNGYVCINGKACLATDIIL